MAKKFDFLSPGIEIREIDQSFLPQEAEATGPIIIGRTRKGPANKPVKIRNLDDYVSVFGLPIPGGAGAQGDVWRDGNTTGPTYASYAAQAWLASENSPITVVRIAGDQHPQATDAGKAGWNLGGDITTNVDTNSTGYGLFLIESASADSMTTGSLAAVFYVKEGYLALSGTAAGSSDLVEQAGTLVESVGSNCEFKLVISGSGVAKKTRNFNFSRNSTKYLRTVFNTNPQLVNGLTTPSAQKENYWLGESFAREVDDLGLSSNARGTVYGILLPLQSGSASTYNWGAHKEAAAEACSGWVISQQEKGQVDLFKLKSLHVGEDIQKDYMIAIENISAPANAVANPYGTFTVAIKTLSGQTVERYTGLNFNPSSPDYIAKRIGDQYLEWDETDRRYRTYGDFQNQSNIVYVELKQFIKDGGGQGFLPAGFKGPVRPKGFTLVSGSSGPNALGDTTDDKTPATATLKIDDSRKIQTGTGMIISAGTDAGGGGVFVDVNTKTALDTDAFTIAFGGVNAAIKGSNGTSLASKSIEFVFKNAADVSGETVGVNQIMISACNNDGSNYADVATVATIIAAVINGDQNNSAFDVANRTFSQAVKFGTDVSGLLATPTNGGDPDSVFVASVVNTSGVKIQLRGSQGVDSGTNAANFGAYGGAWASTISHVKVTSTSSDLTNDGSGDQTTVTAGDATNATTITVTDGAGSANVLTANVDFFVDGNDSDATAIDNTVSNLATVIDGLSAFTAAGDASTNTITITHAIAGSVGNSALLEFANGASGTFTNQGNADDTSEAFTGGSDTTDDFAGAFVRGNASMPSAGGVAGVFVDGPTDFTASFLFPSLALRGDGTEGGAPDPYRAYYGIRPKISTTSNQYDPDYCDYLRRLPAGIDNYVASGDFEHSFTFTLDDLVINTSTNTVTYTADSHGSTSYTTLNTFADLLNLNVRQFLMPLHGGFDGFDVTEKEPLRDDLISSTRSDTTDYIHYTINKALDAVKDPEVVPANMLLIPGIRKPVITDRVIDTAEMRKDVLAIVDLEGDYKPSAERVVADTDSSALGSVSTAVSNIKQRNLNSSYACAFYPWVQASDNLNGGNLVWLPPSVAALGAFGRSESRSELWFAPAGFNRGGLGSLGGPRGPKVLQARQRLDSKERDLLYEVNINPIATFPAEGVVVFGQKTLQADASALDRINVRRLVLYLKAEVSNISRNLLFDQNLETTWNRFKAEVEPLLSSTRSRFGLSDYKVVLDETTTTADLIDRNIMYAKIYIKPARAIEYIVVDFVITNTGADFT